MDTQAADRQLIPYQVCRSSSGWCPVRVASSGGERIYTVFVSPWSARESICECEGYRYRGTCRHQDIAAEQVCRWSELTGKPQTEEEHELLVCAACGGPTRWEIDVR